MRSIYAEVTTAVLTETKAKTTENGVTVTVDNGVVTATKTYTTQQQVAGWISDEHKVGDLTLTDNEAPAKGNVTISATSTGNVKIGNVEKNGTSGGSTGGGEGAGG